MKYFRLLHDLRNYGFMNSHEKTVYSKPCRGVRINGVFKLLESLQGLGQLRSTTISASPSFSRGGSGIEEVVRPICSAEARSADLSARSAEKNFSHVFSAMRKRSRSIKMAVLGKKRPWLLWSTGVSMVGPQLGRETDAVAESAYISRLCVTTLHVIL